MDVAGLVGTGLDVPKNRSEIDVCESGVNKFWCERVRSGSVLKRVAPGSTLRRLARQIAIPVLLGGMLAHPQNLPTPSINLGPQNPYQGSVTSGEKTNQVINLSFRDAVDLALRNNLGLIETGQGARASRAQRLEFL